MTTETNRLGLADLGMMYVVLIWGFHFIVLKEGLNYFEPVTYNALRFALALPFLALVAWARHMHMRMSNADARHLLLLVASGPLVWQFVFPVGLGLTTATNAALIVATLPAWVAVESMLMGRVIARRALMAGVGVTLLGVSLVVLSSGGVLRLNANDALGGGILLLGIIFLAQFTIRIKPLLRDYGSAPIAIWTHLIVTAGLLLGAAPDLLTLNAGDFSAAAIWPLVYSGFLAAALGRFMYNFALDKIGATRAAVYQNFNPLITAVFAALLLGEALTPGLGLGAFFTLLGVGMVRQFTHERTAQATPTGAVMLPRGAGTD
ncbi:MAG: DMT family transporter [Anaerolineales bacterium]